MPKMNGIQACSKIREIAPFVPVMFPSGYTGPLQKEAIHSIEESFFIYKQFKISELLSITSKRLEIKSHTLAMQAQLEQTPATQLSEHA